MFVRVLVCCLSADVRSVLFVCVFPRKVRVLVHTSRSKCDCARTRACECVCITVRMCAMMDISRSFASGECTMVCAHDTVCFREYCDVLRRVYCAVRSFCVWHLRMCCSRPHTIYDSTDDIAIVECKQEPQYASQESLFATSSQHYRGTKCSA